MMIKKIVGVFIWGSNIYSSQKFYAFSYRNMTTSPSFTWLWKSKCIPRIKFFGWLLFVDRLNTRNMLRRRHYHLDNGYNCVMCSLGIEEDINHLFFDYPFAQTCWQTLHIHWGNDHDVHAKIILGKINNAHLFFMEIFLIATWEIWKLRNDKIFNQGTVSRNKWLFNFKKQVHL